MPKKLKEHVPLIKKRITRPNRHKKNLNKRDKPKTFWG